MYNSCQVQYSLVCSFIGYIIILLLGYCILNQLNFIEYQYQNLYKTNMEKTNTSSISDVPFIFIGGHKNTGIELMGIILDSHTMIRCGPDPIVTKNLLRYRWNKLHLMERLIESGITATVLNDATAAFIATIIIKMGPNAPRLCHKDSESFEYLKDLDILFPKAKFIHMVRDGRAIIASEISKKINTSYTLTNITETFLTWDELTIQMLEDCGNIGHEKCLTVHYECLVLDPLREVRKVLVKSIHNHSIDAWSKANSILSMDFITFMNENSIVLKELNYLTDEIPPNYATICNK
ncbi:unnamed protein product [Schistosoma turkestanicum]|nr:unnamed protein product [Schistosoma turkestanicum]